MLYNELKLLANKSFIVADSCSDRLLTYIKTLVHMFSTDSEASFQFSM